MAGLSGTTILLTRAEEANRRMEQLLRQRGARVLTLPTIEIVEPDDWSACDRAIINIHQYDGVIFTSTNAVDRFLQRIAAINEETRTLLSQKPVYAVGERTEERLTAVGIPVARTPEVYSADALAHSFAGEDLRGRRLLLPRGDLASNALPDALTALGALVDSVVVYKTIPPASHRLEELRSDFAHGKIDAVTFFSPSAVRNFVQMMGTRCLEGVLLAVIGPTTRAAAESLGLSVTLVAKKATAELLVETLEEYLAANPS